MNQRILHLEIEDRVLDPAQAELLIWAQVERKTATTELRGRLTGPHCLHASTVEVAYPLRPLPSPPKERLGPVLSMRVVIPEPSFWDPQSPFLYRGVVELWEDGSRCDRATLYHGLRTLSLGPGGLRWNGKSLTLQGTTRLPTTEEEMRRLRQAGYNLLVPTAEEEGWWPAADQAGFLVLARLPRSADGWPAALTLARHACCLGWLLPQEVGPDDLESLPAATRGLIGMELERVPSAPLPGAVQFVVCPEALLSALVEIPLPRLVLRSTATTPAGPGVVGWIDA